MTTPSQQTIAADGSGACPHNAGTNTAPNPGPNPGPLASLTQSSVVPNDLQREADQMLKSGLPEAVSPTIALTRMKVSCASAADMFAAGKGMTEKTAEQKMAADMQATRMAAMRAVAETSKPSSTSTSAPGLAQQMAASLTSGQASAASGQDMSQRRPRQTRQRTRRVARVVLRPAIIQVASPVAGNRPSRWRMAVWRVGSADRTLLHRLEHRQCRLVRDDGEASDSGPALRRAECAHHP